VSTHSVEITVDGKTFQETIESRKLLAHFLRDDLNVTSLNIGCDTSQCGACTVNINGESVKSCTVLAVQASGTSIKTAASHGDGAELSVIQKSFRGNHALQCGYCTPGMITTTAELLKNNPTPSEDEIRDSLHGNICRCTGYNNIVEAVKEAAKQMQEGAPSC